MNNFTQRAITGTLFVLLLAGSVLWSFFSFSFVFLAFALLGIIEFYRLAEKTGVFPQRIYGAIVAGILFASFTLTALFNDARILSINLPLIAGFFIIELYRKKENPFLNIAMSILGLFYVVIPFALWNILVYEPWMISEMEKPENSSNHYPYILLGYMFLLWTNDTSAYLAGRALGKNKLFERISPKKTWEGFIGGIILTVVVSLIISRYFVLLSVVDWISIAVIVSVTGTFGDLSESLFKRSIGVKDSGTILPGHGGILDRFDGLFLSSYFVFAYILIFKM